MKASILSLACLGAALSAEPRAQESLWRIQASDDGTFLATVAMDHPSPSGNTIATLLNVGFGRKDGCSGEIGIAVLNGGRYGNPIGKISPERTEPAKLLIDHKPLSTPAPFVVRYDNGLEAVFRADRRIIGALAAGTTADVQIVPGTPMFEFPITGASEAVAEAQRRCMLTR